MQAVRPPHTRATTSRTHQFRVRDTSDVRQRSASPQRFCVPLLVSWSSGFHASSRNTSFLPTLVSRSPQFCDLPPPSVLARTRLMRERHCPSRARRSSIHTHSSHASTVLRSAPHHQCSPHTRLSHPNVAHARHTSTGHKHNGFAMDSSPAAAPSGTVAPVTRPEAQTKSDLAQTIRTVVRTDRKCDGRYRTHHNLRGQRTASDALESPPARRANISDACSRIRPNKAFSRPPCWCDFPPSFVPTVRAVQNVAIAGRRLMHAVSRLISALLVLRQHTNARLCYTGHERSNP